jgi:bile acid:Na+ symporter, BASS family
MFRLNDLFLLLVIFSSMLTGIFLPRFGAYFQPYPLYFVMFLLFLSFLSIRLGDIGKALKGHWLMAVWLTVVKLALLPVLVYLLLKMTCPRFAVAGLLLSGVSTGVVAPFIATVVRTNGPLVLLMVVITSLLVPFTLPMLVECIMGMTLEISVFAMMKMLSLVIFVPILTVEFLRKASPHFLGVLTRHRYPISLATFAIINFGVFSKYSAYFRQQPGTLLHATLVAAGLGALYFFLGIFVVWGAEPENRIASTITIGNMNNVLIIVFSSQFFGPLEATVAAMYMIPFFGLIFAMRACERRNMPEAQGVRREA